MILIISGIYYLWLLSNGTLRLFEPELYDNVFNTMLVNLFHWDFTVSREAIGSEAFTRNGNTYSYFGIFPAIIRIFVLPFASVLGAHLARVSCLIAMLLFLMFQLRALRICQDCLPYPNRSRVLFWVMIVAIVLSGPQIYLLGSSWVFHEPVFWAAAMGAAFNLIVLRCALGDENPSHLDLILLALIAGLAINTRPSVGLALYLGTALLTVRTIVLTYRKTTATRPTTGAQGLIVDWVRSIRDARAYLPTMMLIIFAVVAGTVNANRWGHPFTFADFRYYDFAHRQPYRLEMIRTYGELNISRIWVSALYYVSGIPYLLKNLPPFAQYLQAHFDGLEAPPISGLVTNPLSIVLAGVGLYRLCIKPDLSPESTSILRLTLIGHSFAIILVLSAMYLALRYRFDFAPFMTLAAFIGYRSAMNFISTSDRRKRRLIYASALILCGVGIISSHYVLLVHKVWSTGVPMEVRRSLLPYAPFARGAFAP